jgi:hypothetical protein
VPEFSVEVSGFTVSVMDDAVVDCDVSAEAVVVPAVGVFAVVAVVTEEVEDFVVAPPDGVVLGGLSHSGCK